LTCFLIDLSYMTPRSPKFPVLTLSEAIDLLRLVAAADPEPSEGRPRHEILKLLGYASFHGPAARHFASLRAYDLIEKKEQGLAISELGRVLLGNGDEATHRAALHRAALSPMAFRMLWRRVRHSSGAEMRELLLERGFSEPGSKRATRVYRENDTLAGLASLEIEPELPDRGPRKEGAREQRGALRESLARSARQPGPPQHPTRGPSLVLPLSTGNAIIPKGITEAEFTTLMQTLRTWREQLVG